MYGLGNNPPSRPVGWGASVCRFQGLLSLLLLIFGSEKGFETDRGQRLWGALLEPASE